MAHSSIICVEKSSEQLPVSNETNVEMIKCLKIMSCLGYLPISWIKPDHPEYAEKKFKITLRKSLAIACFDIVIALIVVAFVPFWHLLNVGPDFDFHLLLKPDYYSHIMQGSSTSTLSYFSFIFYPSFFWWIYIKVGL